MFTNNTSQSISPKRRDLISDDLDELMKLNYHQYLKAEKEKSDKEALRNFIINCDEGSNDLDELMPFPSRQNLNGHPEENGVEELRDLIINIGEEANRKLEEICKENDEYNYNCKEMEKIASCSSLNMKLQYAVNKLLSKVQYTLDKRRKDKIAVEEYLEEVDNKNQLTKLKAKKYFKPISLFASPYFRDVRGMAPPENEDTTKKRENHDITAYVQPPRPWMLFEKHMLINAVYSNCLGFILKPYKTRRNYLRDKLKDDLKNLTEAEEASLKKQIKEIEKEINKQCRKYRDEVIIEAKDHIRWHEIALDGYRTGDECEIMWNNYMSIFVKKDPFTEEEDRKLKELVEKYSGKNWDAIAEELQTGRSAIQCFERYQRSLNTAMHKKYWTPEEDAKLAHLVESNKIGNFIPWNIVCSQMEGRERHQIINRYERTINNRIKRTPWTKEEDAMLLMCVKKYGCHWIQMKEYLPGRNPYTIRERYVNMLDPYIKHGPWSKAEDQKLIALTQKYGYGRWSRIAKEMKGRTDNMCLIRANNLGLKRGEEIDMKTHVKEELSDEYEFSEAIYGPRRKPTRTSMRADIQREALETLKSALMRVAPSVIDETMGTINVPCISLSLMKDLFKELFKNEQNKTSANWKPRYLSTDGISKIDFAKRKKGIKKKFGIDEESASEEEESENVPGIKIDRDSYFNEVHNVLRSQLYEIGNLMHLPKTIEQTNLSSRRAAELKILRTFYQQKLKCSSIPLEEEDFIFCGSNYNLTLADIIYRFVHPPPTVEDNAILLPPNLATLNGMDVMELAENRLNRTGKLINRSKHYIRYLIKRTSDSPKCIKCCIAENTEACQKFNINQMKNYLILPTKAMVKTAMVESGDPSVQVENCCCEDLANSRTEVELLSERFLSLFMWPYLLSLTNLQTGQEELMIRKKMPLGAPRKYPFTKRINRKTTAKKKSNEKSTVLPRGKRKRLGSIHSRKRKVVIKQEPESEDDSEVIPAVTSLPSQTSLRRSPRLATSRDHSYNDEEPMHV